MQRSSSDLKVFFMAGKDGNQIDNTILGDFMRRLLSIDLAQLSFEQLIGLKEGTDGSIGMLCKVRDEFFDGTRRVSIGLSDGHVMIRAHPDGNLGITIGSEVSARVTIVASDEEIVRSVTRRESRKQNEGAHRNGERGKDAVLKDDVTLDLVNGR
jgi:hypothetical protein